MSSTERLEIKNYIGLTGNKPIRFIASDVDGTLVNTLHKPSSFDVSMLHKGVYLVKMKNKNIVRVEKVTIK